MDAIELEIQTPLGFRGLIASGLNAPDEGGENEK
jgi:hypothetical protein